MSCYMIKTQNYWDIKCISFRACFSFWLIIILNNILFDLSTSFVLLLVNIGILLHLYFEYKWYLFIYLLAKRSIYRYKYFYDVFVFNILRSRQLTHEFGQLTTWHKIIMRMPTICLGVVEPKHNFILWRP